MSYQIYKKPNAVVSGKKLNSFFKTYNKAITAIRARNGRVEKFIFETPNQLRTFWEESESDPVIISATAHLTEDKKDLNQFGPYQLLDFEENGKEIWAAIDGYMHKLKPPNGGNELYYFSEILKSLMKNNPDIIYQEELQEMIKMLLGTGNNMIFMDNEGAVTILNEASGAWRENIWVSSAHSISDTVYHYNYKVEKNEWEVFDEPEESKTETAPVKASNQNEEIDEHFDEFPGYGHWG